MSRPPLPIGTYGRIKRTLISAEGQPMRWRAYVRFRDHDGVTRPVVRHTPEGKADPRGAAAEQALRAALADRSKLIGSEGITPDTTLSALAKVYREELVANGRAAKTLERYDHGIKSVEQGMGSVRIREASTQRADTFIQSVKEHQGPSAAKTARTVLSGMMSVAVRYGAAQTNPVREARTVAIKKVKHQAFEPGALRQLLHDIRTSALPCPALEKAAEDQGAADAQPQRRKYRPPTVATYCSRNRIAGIITMLAATGVRMSEVLALRWQDIDWEAKTIAITGKVIWVKGKGLLRVADEDDPKNTRRTLPLPDFAIVMLLNWQLDAQPNEHDVIFPSRVGTLLDPTNVNDQWRRVRAALGLDWVTGHTFRRTIATILDDKGLNARIAADQLGHAQVSMTQDVYMARGRTHSVVAEILNELAEEQPGGTPLAS